ncbi:hypothetical protein AZI85_09170 [Bdellovibrio bacteriovorus]|uniref:Uncharacterized protein n=1 Tax=Bdellovibrio bacteriovorus TaxID=959 RepID=A0A150WDG8_BDEBC|nr:hypothetical protein [Bdellovibrio bacteriovorus]KYG61115.1 hypothetical protein AZI85_09170 [Bdellovibrio bacteriovorus]
MTEMTLRFHYFDHQHFSKERLQFVKEKFCDGTAIHIGDSVYAVSIKIDPFPPGGGSAQESRHLPNSQAETYFI